MLFPHHQSSFESLYDQDYYLWLEQQVEKLRSRQLHTLDIDLLAEELADMGRSEKRAVRSNLTSILIHLLKLFLLLSSAAA